LMTYLIILANTSWNPSIHLLVVHSYLRVVTTVHLFTSSLQIQSAHGTASEVMIVSLLSFCFVVFALSHSICFEISAEISCCLAARSAERVACES
jgi:hypothetical protein